MVIDERHNGFFDSRQSEKAAARTNHKETYGPSSTFKPLPFRRSTGGRVERRRRAHVGGLRFVGNIANRDRQSIGQRRFNSTVGVPLPSTYVAIRDEAGADVRISERGEICIKGPQLMDGYWMRPEEAANVMTRDGYSESGDIGTVDEQGFVRIVDRKKDMVIVLGLNVYPTGSKTSWHRILARSKWQRSESPTNTQAKS